jgi:hypothetical protein
MLDHFRSMLDVGVVLCRFVLNPPLSPLQFLTAPKKMIPAQSPNAC